ncbi:MAG: flagellar basal body-associated FliL family protein [Candidatus Lindowbacteria bacterium]|nr:flagellar basal body-associated FliL family protein [Candidatus Lindowbacteria bacterium]
MADEDGAEEEGGQDGEKKPLLQSKPVKMLLGVAIIVALLSITGVVAYYVAHNIKGAEVDVEAGADIGQGEISPPPLTFELGTFTTILTDESSQNFNLRAKILLTVSDERSDADDVTRELVDRKSQLVDAINEVLIGTDPKSFMGSPAKRREGYNELRASITRAVNVRMKNKIDGVYIEEFIFQ